MNVILGQLLLWGGFLSGALATVWRTDISSEDRAEVWSTIPWTWYLISIAVCFAGVVILQLARRASKGSTEKTVESLSEIKSSLDRLISNVDKLDAQLDSMAPSKITKYIDDVLADDFRKFADGRDSITAEYGLGVFAEVMSQFSAGERAINRAWSAGADGYVDEVRICVDRAKEMLAVAKKELHQS